MQIQTSKNEDAVGTSIAKSIIYNEAALQEEEASASLVAAESSVTSAERSDAKLAFLNNALDAKGRYAQECVQKN